jgi:HD-GYP domain-containing protein (c-di-GMP phosphodiesterase class II)
MLRDVTESKKTQDKLMQTIDRLTKLSEAGIKTIEKIVEHRDPYTSMHQKNTGEFAYHIAKKMGIDEENSQRIRYAGMVHDVGKVSVPIMILNKPSKLTGFEHATIKHHVEVSYDILMGVDNEIPVAEMVLHHHERMDGSGYPSGLKGDEISQGGRILAVADVLDAMTSHRPYRPRLTFDETMDYLRQNSGTLYDMRVVLAVFELFREGKLFQIKSKKTWI